MICLVKNYDYKQGCISRASVRNPAIDLLPPSGQDPATECPQAKRIPLYLVLKGSKKIVAPSAPITPSKPYIFVFYCVVMHYSSNCGPF